jgi:hypothetical protein
VDGSGRDLTENNIYPKRDRKFEKFLLGMSMSQSRSPEYKLELSKFQKFDR